MILAFGWFGFNAGSSLAGTDLRISVVATNTMIASATGACAAMLFMMAKFGKPDPSMMANGMLAGLVAITAPCAFVTAPAAGIIGAIAGVVVCLSVLFVENTLKLDDPVGAISVHGVCGALGVLSLGIFADGVYGEGLNGVPGGVRGLLYGDSGQFFAEVIGVVTCFAFIFPTFFVFFKVVDKLVGNRVAAEDEINGLDMPEMGALAYPDFGIGLGLHGPSGVSAPPRPAPAAELPEPAGSPAT
jgi:Amt family ammonium transporter